MWRYLLVALLATPLHADPLRSWRPCYTIGSLNACAAADAYLETWALPDFTLSIGNQTGIGMRIIGIGVFLPEPGATVWSSGYYPREWELVGDRTFYTLVGPNVPDFKTYFDADAWFGGLLGLPAGTPFTDPDLTFIWRGYRERDGLTFDCWESNAANTECVVVTPEPSTVTLLGVGLGLLGLGALRRRRAP